MQESTSNFYVEICYIKMDMTFWTNSIQGRFNAKERNSKLRVLQFQEVVTHFM